MDLNDHVVEVIFTIFDEDGDGQLSNKVFFVYKLFGDKVKKEKSTFLMFKMDCIIDIL